MRPSVPPASWSSASITWSPNLMSCSPAALLKSTFAYSPSPAAPDSPVDDATTKVSAITLGMSSAVTCSSPPALTFLTDPKLPAMAETG